MGRKFIDLIGEKFGKLTVVSFVDKKGTRTYWNCVCECGGKRIVSNDHLKRGDVTDCGCYRRHISYNKKHGMSDKPIYTIWLLMKERCFNYKRREYKDYGGRGIKVCSEWLDATKFIEWALNNGYTEGLTIDRIDNNGNYEPNNCRWVDRETQANNKRNNRLITYKGETKTITQWAKEHGLTYYIVKKRIDNYGWTFEKAITEPINQKYSNRGRRI